MFISLIDLLNKRLLGVTRQRTAVAPKRRDDRDRLVHILLRPQHPVEEELNPQANAVDCVFALAVAVTFANSPISQISETRANRLGWLPQNPATYGLAVSPLRSKRRYIPPDAHLVIEFCKAERVLTIPIRPTIPAADLAFQRRPRPPGSGSRRR